MANIFITGATGYLGRSLIPQLLAQGHHVRGLVRPGSELKLPAGCEAVIGEALDAESYRAAIAPSDTFIHLIGVAHPGPTKARQFQTIDLASAKIAAANAHAAGIRHFVYVSVAQPAPIMQSYLDARAAGEQAIRDTGMAATFLRPWYVLGPGHRWPYFVLPLMWLLEKFSATNGFANRLGFVTLKQMTAALCDVVACPAEGVRIVSVLEIRARASEFFARGK